MRAEVEVTQAVNRLEGPLLFLQRVVNAGLNEAVEVVDAHGRTRLGRVAALERRGREALVGVLPAERPRS